MAFRCIFVTMTLLWVVAEAGRSAFGDPGIFGIPAVYKQSDPPESREQPANNVLAGFEVPPAPTVEDSVVPSLDVENPANATGSSAKASNFESTFEIKNSPEWISARGPRAHTEMGTVHFPEDLGTIKLPEMPHREPYRPDMPPKKREVTAEFEDGLTVKTKDEYFSLTFHNLTQIDYRDFQKTGDPLVDSFVVPRQRWYVLGNVSPNVRYYTVINRGYNSLDILDSFLDLNFGLIDREKFQIRVGRTKTPYGYEYVKISEVDLIAAERSVFIGNLAPNREEGIMAHGKLLERSFEYAVGVFNGPRRSFEDTNNSKDLFTFGNLKPFLNGDSDVMRQLNLSGSFNVGNEHNPVQPIGFRTANDQSSGTSPSQVSPTFLQFNNNAFVNGLHMQWSGDVAYYYRNFGLLAGYQGAIQDYGVSATPLPANFVGVTSATTTRVPFSGYSVSAFYFLTGEEITRRANLMEPRESFTSLRRSKGGGIGAIELFARFANMQIGNSIFTGGLADPTKWSNSANVTDVGFNWYLNHYTKLTFDWQNSQFGSPVSISPTNSANYNNLFWFRTQVFF